MRLIRVEVEDEVACCIVASLHWPDQTGDDDSIRLGSFVFRTFNGADIVMVVRERTLMVMVMLISASGELKWHINLDSYCAVS